ncbi:crotonase/enoyl-CoA hydratase family protein [Novosphingobium sp. ERN07]|uniref:crotonase/enoyl-CoA hydratase family protein n=1 Tax=Novosphingobium sp. ERN07 TaxID=2726187 RepID=UPI001456444B|nr:crotonase/enoyl-CoA hydratase family protein [Novosphingobium sp. ERN07]NLR73081.1 crotonase/enoyl-CoA hydratase family protein [Novosphingobium sp. ERN07]
MPSMNFHDRVTVTVENHVAHVLLDRADKMNALDDAMFEAIIAAGHYLHTERGVRVVVLSGAGRSFCAGLDLSSMGQADRWGEGGLAERTHGNANRAQQAAMVWRKLPMPVVAAVHGVCFGGGLQVASGADIRFIASDARLAVMEVKWGLVPDMAGYVLWRGNVRDDMLRELTYTHREFNGEEAVRFGFATHVSADPLADAMKLAQEIASKSPTAVRGAKMLSNRTPDMTVDEVLMAESIAQHELMYSKNQMEAVRAGMEKRPAEFVDP